MTKLDHSKTIVICLNLPYFYDFLCNLQRTKKKGFCVSVVTTTAVAVASATTVAIFVHFIPVVCGFIWLH